jgi:hypothetical protein
VQTLAPTLFPCYAPGDRAIAAAVATFLERGADVRVFLDDGEIRPGEDLIGKARDARQADLVLVFFSRESMPSRWARAQWEAALLTEPAAEDVRIAFVRCDDCAPPAVLKPRFDLAGLPLKALRELKRWVRRRGGLSISPPSSTTPANEADIEILAIALADRSGVETVPTFDLASEFAVAYRHDFDEVIILDCAGRSTTALAGDLGAQLGLHLEADLDTNLDRLREFCSAHRFLLILADAGASYADPPEFTFGGRSSTLIATTGAPTPATDQLRQIQRIFAEPDPDLAWPELCDLARNGRRLTRDQGRIAESYELMERWHALAELRSDRKVLDESARELVWILEGWGRDQEAIALHTRRITEFDDQLHFQF